MKDPWSGSIDTKGAYGYNWMGQFIMRIREDMFGTKPIEWEKLLKK